MSDIFPSLPHPPPKGANIDAIIKWAKDNTQTTADLFRRIQAASRAVSSVAKHASTHWPQSGTDPLATAAPSGGYASTAAIGTADSLVRSDAVLVYPEALATAALRTRTLTLTDDVLGALLTPGGVWTANYLAFLAPGGSQSFRVGQQGTLGVWGSAPSDNIGLNFSNSISSATLQQIMSTSITGSGTGGVTGIGVNLLNSGTNAIENYGFAATCNQSTAGATGNIAVFKATYLGSGVKSPASYCAFKSLPTTILLTSGTLTELNQFWANTPTLITGTVTTHRGFYCADLKYGTTRIGFDCATISTGTPTLASGVRVGLHSVGTTRRALVGGNSVESTNYYLITSTAGMGLVMRDTADGNYYLINTTGGVLNAPVNLGPGPIAL